MSVWEKFERIDPRLIYALLLVFIAIPLMKPLGLPIAIMPETQGTFGAIDKLPNGSSVLVSFDYSAGAVPELDPQAQALLTHFLKKDMKIVAVASEPGGPPFADSNMKLIYGAAGKKYGENYINLGYFAAGESGLTALAEDIRKVYKADYSGKPIDSFPMMANLKTVKDFAMAVTLNVGPLNGADTHAWIRQVYTAHKVPVVLGVVTVMAPANATYFQSKQAVGLLAGLRSAAEYELLVGRPGGAVAGMDAQSAAHVLIIACIILGNIGYFVRRSRKEASGDAAGSAKGGGN